MTPIDLHGYLAHIEFRRDLLVEQAASNERQDLTLPCRQAGVSRLKVRESGGVLPTHSVRIDPDPNGVEQVLISEGFGQEFYGTCPHRAHGHGNVPVVAYENDRDVDVQSCHFMLKIETAHARHPDIEHKASLR